MVDPQEIARAHLRIDNQCEHLAFPSAINQMEIICQCGEYHTLANDGYSCLARCPE